MRPQQFQQQRDVRRQPCRWAKLFLRDSDREPACPSSVSVSLNFSSATVCILSAASTAFFVRICLTNAESSLAPTGAAFGNGAVGLSAGLVCSASHGLPNCITVSCDSACIRQHILRSLLSLVDVLPFPTTRRTLPTSPISSAAQRALPFPVVSYVYPAFSRVGSPCSGSATGSGYAPTMCRNPRGNTETTSVSRNTKKTRKQLSS